MPVRQKDKRTLSVFIIRYLFFVMNVKTTKANKFYYRFFVLVILECIMESVALKAFEAAQQGKPENPPSDIARNRTLLKIWRAGYKHGTKLSTDEARKSLVMSLFKQ